MKKHFILLILCFTMTNYIVLSRDQSSKVKVDTLAEVKVEQPVEDFAGTIELEEGASLEGETISFTGGVLSHAGGKAKISAKMNSTTIFLDGSKTFKGDGKKMSRSFFITGQGNRLEGEIIPFADIEVDGAGTEVTFAVTRKIDKNISLAGSTMILEEDLRLGANNTILGNGIVKLNGKRLITGSNPTTWSSQLYFDNAGDMLIRSDILLSSTWTFSGSINVIEGSVNTLSLFDEGTILIEKGSSLLINNMRIDGINNTNFSMMDNLSSVTFSNVDWIQDDNFILNAGGVMVKNKFKLDGAYKFTYHTSEPCMIAKNAKLVIDRNMTFSYDPMSINNELLQCEDSSSLIYLKNGTLHVSTTGLKLTKGTLLVEGKSKIVSELLYGEFPADVVSGGLEIGDGTEVNDMRCILSQGSSLKIASGDVAYNNYNSDSWNMLTVNSILKLATGTRLILEKDMDIGDGRVQLSPGSAILQNNGARLIGSREMLKS